MLWEDLLEISSLSSCVGDKNNTAQGLFIHVFLTDSKESKEGKKSFNGESGLSLNTSQ